MSTEECDSTIRKALKILCFNNGWSYGVFWGFDQRNSLMLTMQECYFEEQMGGVIEDMILQVHMLGGGIIGQAAFTKKQRWIFLDSHKNNSVESGGDLFQDDSEFHCQFSSGIKTIAVISVEPRGVVQFGSTRKILERTEFVDQTKRIFREMENNLPENLPSSSNSFESIISPENSHFSHFNSINPETPSISTWSNIESSFDELIQAVDYTTVSNDFFPQPMDLPSLPSSFTDHKMDTPSNIPLNFPANSSQSSITNEKCSNNLRQWDDVLMTLMNGTPDRNVGPKTGLFSKLGIEELLDGLSGASNAVTSGSGFEDRVTKRRKMDSNELAGFPCFSRNASESMQMNHVINNFGPKPNVDEKFSTNGEAVKVKKRKAKPGTRPRPKDRQMIQDRFVELRQLIPNGEKMSIDCLLDRTIKHLLFLQSVTLHADRVKQADKPKRVNNGGGVTWACELGDQAMVCPLIVEDLSIPGQMLIEMLCEEQGFFLEIVDIIQGFGLNILKGLMEVRDSKIWARFIVEAEGKRCVATRHEIFSALLQLIQMKSPPNAINLIDNQVGSVINQTANNSLLNQQSVGPLAVSLGETRSYTKL